MSEQLQNLNKKIPHCRKRSKIQFKKNTTLSERFQNLIEKNITLSEQFQNLIKNRRKKGIKIDTNDTRIHTRLFSILTQALK